MAKKGKHKNRQETATVAPAQAANNSNEQVKTGAFCIRSSLGVPFQVVSNRQLVAEVPEPTPDEWRELVAICNSLVGLWSSRGAVVLADFEGEFIGLEGELVSAAFQRTLSIDHKSLRPLSSSGNVGRDMGFLVDFRCAEGVALVKRIMECDNISKVIWGADGDLTSLCYTPVASPLGIRSTRVVDAQLAFSNPDRRLSMANMLERLPAPSIATLPAKGSIDFMSMYAYNRKALPLPLDKNAATYAIDDLHRLDAVVRYKTPGSGSYAQAEKDTSLFLSLLSQTPMHLSEKKLWYYHRKLQEKDGGIPTLEKAVRVKRHLIALRRVPVVPGDATAKFAEIEALADAKLTDAGVMVPEDLSLHPHCSTAELPEAIAKQNTSQAKPQQPKRFLNTDSESEENLVEKISEAQPLPDSMQNNATKATPVSQEKAGKRKKTIDDEVVCQASQEQPTFHPPSDLGTENVAENATTTQSTADNEAEGTSTTKMHKVSRKKRKINKMIEGEIRQQNGSFSAESHIPNSAAGSVGEGDATTKVRKSKRKRRKADQRQVSAESPPPMSDGEFAECAIAAAVEGQAENGDKRQKV